MGRAFVGGIIEGQRNVRTKTVGAVFHHAGGSGAFADWLGSGSEGSVTFTPGTSATTGVIASGKGCSPQRVAVARDLAG